MKVRVEVEFEVVGATDQVEADDDSEGGVGGTSTLFAVCMRFFRLFFTVGLASRKTSSVGSR